MGRVKSRSCVSFPSKASRMAPPTRYASLVERIDLTRSKRGGNKNDFFIGYKNNGSRRGAVPPPRWDDQGPFSPRKWIAQDKRVWDSVSVSIHLIQVVPCSHPVPEGSSPSLRWGCISFFIDHTDKRQLPVVFIKIQAVSKHKFIGDLKAHIIQRDVDFTAFHFVQQRADF